MLGKTIAFAVVLFAATASAQWLEATIPVGNRPELLGYNPQENKIYCAHRLDSRVFVIDGVSNEVTDTVTLRNDLHEALVYNPVDNKMYCSQYDEEVAVIDCVADSVVAVIELAWVGGALCYNSAQNKVYCGDRLADTVYVVDGATDSVIGRINVYGGHVSLFHSGLDKVYLGEVDGSLTVVEGASDSILGTVSLGGAHPYFLALNNTGGKLYCSGHEGRVSVVDCQVDSIADSISVSPLVRAICYSRHRNVLYCGFWGGSTDILVVCGEGDSVLRTIPGSGGAVHAMCLDTLRQKLYVAQGAGAGHVTVIDALVDTVLLSIAVGNVPRALAWNSQQSRVYVANNESNSVSVIRDSMPVGIAEHGGTRVSPKLPTTLPAPALARLDCRVLDALGRDVTERKAVLSPGVYFLREGHRLTSARKVILTR